MKLPKLIVASLALIQSVAKLIGRRLQPPYSPPQQPEALPYTILIQPHETAQLSPVVPETQLSPVVPEEVQQDRNTLVLGLLDEAWNQGRRTYADLIAYVTEQTGKGCSRRAIASWKKARKLIDSDAA